MQKITPCLWFDEQAEEAVQFYLPLFKNSKINSISRYGEGDRKPAGTALVIYFELDGQPFMALNGGPEYAFTPAISFMVDCEDQSAVDFLWDNLSAGGSLQQCGWLTDKYGVSWQIVPTVLGELMSDPVKGGRVMQALLQMVKIDIAELKRAYKQE